MAGLDNAHATLPAGVPYWEAGGGLELTPPGFSHPAPRTYCAPSACSRWTSRPSLVVPGLPGQCHYVNGWGPQVRGMRTAVLVHRHAIQHLHRRTCILARLSAVRQHPRSPYGSYGKREQRKHVTCGLACRSGFRLKAHIMRQQAQRLHCCKQANAQATAPLAQCIGFQSRRPTARLPW